MNLAWIIVAAILGGYCVTTPELTETALSSPESDEKGRGKVFVPAEGKATLKNDSSA